MNNKEKMRLEFPGFKFKAEDISAFHLSLDSFVLSLKNGKLTHFRPKETDAFLKWLKNNGVKDIR